MAPPRLDPPRICSGSGEFQRPGQPRYDYSARVDVVCHRCAKHLAATASGRIRKHLPRRQGY